MPEESVIKQTGRYHLALLFGVGLLRFINLGFLDLQAWDEALYAVRAEGILRFGGILDQTPFSIGGLYSSLHPPLHIWLTSVSFLLFGTTEFAARLTSAVFGMLTLFVIYRIGKELKDPSVGLIAALLFGLNPFATFFARQGQFDTTMVFFLSLAMLLYLKMDSDSKMSSALYAGIAVGAALMTKLFVGLGIPLSYIVWKALTSKDNRSTWKLFVLSLAVTTLVALPWHAYMTIVRGGGNPLFFLDASAVFERSVYGVEGNVKSLELFYFVNQLIVLFPLGIFFFIPGTYEIFRNRDPRWMFPALWFVVFFLVFSVMRTKLSVYALPMLVPASLISAAVLTELMEGKRTETIASLLLAGTGLAFLWSLSQSWRTQAKVVLNDLFHAHLPSSTAVTTILPFAILSLLVVVLAYVIYRNDLMRRLRPGLPIAVLLPSFVMSSYSILGTDRYQYNDGASELATFLARKQPVGLVVVGFDRNPQLTFYLEGADVGWRNDIEIRRITPPLGRKHFRSWISEQVSDLPPEALVVVEKDKIVRYEWISADEATPTDFNLVFDSRRYAVFQRATASQLALLGRLAIPLSARRLAENNGTDTQ